MQPHLLDMLDNRDLIDESARGRVLGDAQYTALFKDLQSNIVTSHGFDRAHYFFVRFSDGKREIAQYLLGMLAHTAFERAMIRSALADKRARSNMSRELKKIVQKWNNGAPANIDELAHEQLAPLRVVSEYDVYRRRAQVRRKQKGKPSHDYTVNVLLTPSGFAKLGVPAPDSPAFREGMAKRGALLNDPDPNAWGNRSSKWLNVDALIIVAYDPAPDANGSREQQRRIDAFRALTKAYAADVFEEQGDVIRTKKKRSERRGRPVEPFGFRDGISQPVFYAPHKASLLEQRERFGAWDPSAPLRLVLCPDPNGMSPYACGSYFVFRKLEQDLATFRSQAKSIVAQKLKSGAWSRAGKWSVENLEERFVGRERSGAPLVKSSLGHNDFDFKKDGLGVECPFYAHVRKVNPRSDVLQSYQPKDHRIVRRSIPYGPAIERTPSGTPLYPLKYVARPFEKLPRNRGIGLLFMCAQGDIATQFEQIQARWANKPDHPRGKRTAVDTVMGQAPPGLKNLLPVDSKTRPTAAVLNSPYKAVVRLRGGGYFFAPSISFLRGLLANSLAT